MKRLRHKKVQTLAQGHGASRMLSLDLKTNVVETRDQSVLEMPWCDASWEYLADYLPSTELCTPANVLWQHMIDRPARGSLPPGYQTVLGTDWECLEPARIPMVK